MNKKTLEIGRKYLTAKGVPVVLVGLGDKKMIVKVETTGNKVELEPDYELRPYSEAGVNKESRMLLRANGKGRPAAKGAKKPREGSLAAIIDPFLVAGTKTVAEIAAELKKRAGKLAVGRDLLANCRARLVAYKRKGYRIERDANKHVRIVAPKESSAKAAAAGHAS